jgi:hypothetical protein
MRYTPTPMNPKTANNGRRQKISLTWLIGLLALAVAPIAYAQGAESSASVRATGIVPGAVAAEPPSASAPSLPGKTFIFHNAIRDLSEFRAYAEIAARLKPYGTVEVDIGVLAEKSPMHMPGIHRSPWHEYGAYMGTMWAFFPHPKLAPHLSSNWVAKNRELLLGKVAILEELGLGAVFSANETQFLPESFFRQYPHLRGPRVDAPARSKRAEFAWCVDQPETLEMIEWMMAELKRHAPPIQEIHSWSGDSGSGLCWLLLYPGRNGPTWCRAIDPGVRVRKLIEAMDRGVRKGGGPIHVRLAGNLQTDREKIEPLLPSNATFGETFARPGDKSLVVVATRLSEAYPIRGIIDLFAVLEALSNVADPSVRTVDIDTGQSWYYRANEPLATVRRLVAIVENTMKHPVSGQEDPTPKARALAVVWAGEENADRVVQAFNLISKSFGRFSRGRSIGFRDDVILGKDYAYTATNRLMTRPLLIKPEFLTPEEEAYFLPYVFSAEEDDARLDYNTAHTDRRTGLTEYHSLAYRNVHDSALEAAAIFEQVTDAPDGDWFRQLALSLRLWASTVRSHDNFYFAQDIRDRHREGLAAAPRQLYTRLMKTPDLLLWNEIQRDELDNANDLRVLLEHGGLELVARAVNSCDEDSFLYGPDVLGALQKKVDLMRAHWTDGQGYLIPLTLEAKREK